jgi:serine/threonine-protein kinase
MLRYKVADEVVEALNSCLKPDATDRPLMQDVRNVLAKHLLHDRHKALVVFQGQASYLDATRRSVSLRLPSMGEVEIRYDGFGFRVHRVSGDVFVNNRRVAVGDELPGACVVALGSAEQKNQRKYITFDLSHPEIVL